MVKQQEEVGDGTRMELGVKNTREKVFSAAALLACGTNRKSCAACYLCKEQGHEILKPPEPKQESIDERWQ